MNIDDEAHRLIRADVNIERAKSLIARQREIVDELDSDGHDTASARTLLEAMCTTLGAMLEHRGLIIDHIERLERDKQKKAHQH
ncbi:hypothetical protein [Caballeronia sp. LZ043]|uniref:hypothetical protein n=1 Tax=Caballeronia sp. LZ043 TaxID=3038569 RepID=UPI002859F01F|nr:hypothetical protein [Caballeronia sp. LZ043]MDR5826047.1 hypothetical protein [Caballeronia sp. LZ043]